MLSALRTLLDFTFRIHAFTLQSVQLLASAAMLLPEPSASLESSSSLACTETPSQNVAYMATSNSAHLVLAHSGSVAKTTEVATSSFLQRKV